MLKEVSELPANESTTEIPDNDYNDRNEYVYSDKDDEDESKEDDSDESDNDDSESDDNDEEEDNESDEEEDDDSDDDDDWDNNAQKQDKTTYQKKILKLDVFCIADWIFQIFRYD